MTSRRLIPMFAAMRFAVGAGTWLDPDRSMRTFGMGPGPHQPFIAELFGSRDMALALAAADTSSTELRVRALQLGVLADALDTIAALRGIRRRTLPPAAAVLGGGGAALFLILGLVALHHESSGDVTGAPPAGGDAPAGGNATVEATRAIVAGWLDRLPGRSS